jgi:flagellar hook-associated protein 2
MATSISTGGSGLDIPTLVSQLVTAARSPTETRINNETSAANTKLSAVGQIKSAMTGLQTALDKVVGGADTPAYKATAASGAGFTATTASNAVAGNYSIEVVRLASAQKLASAGQAAGATFGGGSLTIAYGDESIEVEVDAGATLADVAAAVNKSAGGKGVVASVVTADDGQHLVFSATDTGSEGALTVSADGDAGLQALAGGLTETVAAADALVRVDGFERTSSSNSIGDLVPGVTLTLTKAAEGVPYNLNVASDNSALKSGLAAFVSAYNSVVGTLKSTSAYDSATKTASALTGDSLVRSLQQQLRGQVSDNVLDLKALGVTIDKDGTMSFDGAAFDGAVAADPEAPARLFGKDGKYSARLASLLDNSLDSYDGTLTQRTNGLDKQIADLNEQLDDLDDRMTKLSDQYTAQFTAMETMITQLQSSASSLNDLLSS